ncbi:MAG: hypothetical protein GX547_08805 [Phycisphaerae bacterium]|nr:hypothetical protein [Phycisphaerae bacterium]
MSDVVQISWGKDVAEKLEHLCEQQKSAAVTLPSGRRLFVCPLEDFAALHSVFTDPDFVGSLERAVADFAEHRGSVRGAGVRPGAEREALSDPGFVQSLERAAEDLMNKRGSIREAGQRPAP